MSLNVVTEHQYPGLTPQIVRRPNGGLSFHVLNQQVEGASVVAIGPDPQGKVVASVLIDMSKAVFGEADQTVHRAPNLRDQRVPHLPS